MLRLGIKPVPFGLLKSTYVSFVESYTENGLVFFDYI